MPVSTLLDHVVSQRQKLESCYRPTDPSAGKLSAVVPWLCAINTRRFYQLLNGKAEPVLYAFDLLWLNGEDLRPTSLLERKERLCDLIHSSKCTRILYADHIEQFGKRFFEEICGRDLEGIVAKRKRRIFWLGYPPYVRHPALFRVSRLPMPNNEESDEHPNQ